MLNNLQQIYLKLLQKESLEKTAEPTSDLIGNKIADKFTRSSKISPQNYSKTNREILREKYIFPELKQKIIDDL